MAHYLACQGPSDDIWYVTSDDCPGDPIDSFHSKAAAEAFARILDACYDLGYAEVDLGMTTHFDDELLEAYDRGREAAEDAGE